MDPPSNPTCRRPRAFATTAKLVINYLTLPSWAAARQSIFQELGYALTPSPGMSGPPGQISYELEQGHPSYSWTEQEPEAWVIIPALTVWFCVWPDSGVHFSTSHNRPQAASMRRSVF